jgi:hypothetical protein
MLITIAVYDVKRSIHADKKTKTSDNILNINRSADEWYHKYAEIAHDI